MTLVGRLHDGLVFPRRVSVLARRLSSLIPDGARVLDLGCGDGTLGRAVQSLRPDVAMQGADVLIRANPLIPVDPFDGEKLPYNDGAFDAVMMVDVLHHAKDPMTILREASRVSRAVLLIKDHLSDPWLAVPRLRLMDFVGNAHHGVALPYNYWTRERWRLVFRQVGLTEDARVERLGLYAWPAALIFEDGLHFLARLRRN